jgi:hypothetical protein
VSFFGQKGSLIEAWNADIVPILIRDPASGLCGPVLASYQNGLRIDALFAWQPTPGTVFFVGYGSSLREDDPFAFRRLDRSTDGFFMKFSYLFRL